MKNRMELIVDAVAENEALARMVISAFLVQMNPTITFVSEVRTAVSEAVTNAVVHAYGGDGGQIALRAQTNGEILEIEIEDYGCGIEDVREAMQPFFTTQPDQERTGIGFALMQSFMDEVEVNSSLGKGTIVSMRKKLAEQNDGQTQDSHGMKWTSTSMDSAENTPRSMP